METALDALGWAKDAGLASIFAFIAFQVFSGAVTHVFRTRTDAELAAMQAEHPWGYRGLMLCKTLGIDSPNFWKLVGGILLARVQAAPSATHEAKHDAEVPPVEPPHESLGRGRLLGAVLAHEATRVAACLLQPDEAFRAVVGVVPVVAYAVAAALRAVGSMLLRHGTS